MTKKAVILARGLGTRMRAENHSTKLNREQSQIASQGVKTLMPIVGKKTLLNFILESLSEAGFTDICLVIGEEQQAIRDFCEPLGYQISFAIQANPLGTANAVLAAEEFVGNEYFVVVNSDNLYPINDLRGLREMEQAGLIAFEKQSLIDKSNISEEKINQFAVLKFDENDYLTQIIEKPEATESESFISMNAWHFSPKIFEACRKIKLSKRKEFELADAVNFAIENLAEKFKAVYSNQGVLDLSSRADVEKLAQKLKENG